MLNDLHIKVTLPTVVRTDNISAIFISEYELTGVYKAAICGLQRIKGNLLVRFEPTNLRILYLKNYLRKLKYLYLNSWVRQ
jgi:hypothetical protein